METTHALGERHPLHAMGPLSAGIAFGASASLFNNIAISIAVFLLNLLFDVVLPRFLTVAPTSFWITEVLPLCFIVIIGILGVWVGTWFVAWLFKKSSFAPEPRGLPVYGAAAFSAPLALWVIFQMIAVIAANPSGWVTVGYLFAQILLFGGSVYLFLELYRRRLSSHAAEKKPLIHTAKSAVAVVQVVAAVLGLAVAFALLHTVEAVILTGGTLPLLVVGANVLLPNIPLIAILAVCTAVFLAVAVSLRKDKSWRSMKATLCTWAAYEYLLASGAAAAGLLTGIAFYWSSSLSFLFSPYTALLTTTIVLFGIVVSCMRYAGGMRDRLFVIIRTVAYIVGFIGQASVLGAIVSLLSLI